MTQLLDPPASPSGPPARPLVGGERPPGFVADRAFRIVATAAGVLVLVVLGLIVFATVQKSTDWFSAEGLGGIFSLTWEPSTNHYGAGALIVMTLIVAAVALVFAVPVSLGIALFVTEVAPRRARMPIVFMIDLLAAIPSVVFGLWMLNQLAGPLAGVYRGVHGAVAGVPVLGSLFDDPSASGLALMTAGIVVAIMITPIITAITREIFATTPVAQKEAALAMGATRWEMIRGAVLPHSRSGVIAAVIIGFGRAVGETIAVALVVGSSQKLTGNLFGTGDTMAGIIANQFGEAAGVQRSALVGLGVVLLVLTIIVGAFARVVVRRSNQRLGIS
ncbi:MAG: phosphate ABC transporter permease subunit PstC, partial [Actinomycetes bacterium]